jgi:hypothetical protein
MIKLKKLFIVILVLFVFLMPVIVSAEDGINPDPVIVEDGPLNSFWDAVQDFIASPSWGSLSAVLVALLVIVSPFVWFWLKKKSVTLVAKLKAKYEYAKAEAGNYKKLYKAYKQDQEVTREKINALFDGFASMIDAMNLRVDYKDKISATLDKAKELTAEPIELEPIPDIEPEDYDDEDILDNDAVEENNKVGW